MTTCVDCGKPRDNGRLPLCTACQMARQGREWKAERTRKPSLHQQMLAAGWSFDGDAYSAKTPTGHTVTVSRRSTERIYAETGKLPLSAEELPF